MKTKKLTLMFVLLLSGIIVSAQSFSNDKGKMKLKTDQTSVPHIGISDQPNTPPDYIIYASNWWNLIKLYAAPDYFNNSSFDSGVGTSQKPRIHGKDRRILPPLPTNPNLIYVSRRTSDAGSR
jgi:hypothetical protein